MRLGIIQGRLLPPVDNHMQEFPADNWRDEFEIINDIGLSHIEWIVTKKSFDDFLQLNLKKYSNKISSICCDHLIDKQISEGSFLLNYLKPVCDFALSNKIKAVTIPLLEESKIDENHKFIDLIKYYADYYYNLDFYFEIDANFLTALKILKLRPNFYLTYDTGNLTSSGYYHREYLQAVLPYIKNIHLKDRTINPVNTVEPGTGDTNFKEIFDILRFFNYTDLFTIQTARGESGKEVDTILRHKKFYEQFI